MVSAFDKYTVPLNKIFRFSRSVEFAFGSAHFIKKKLLRNLFFQNGKKLKFSVTVENKPIRV